MLKLQYFGHLMRRGTSLDSDAGKDRAGEGSDRMGCLDGIINSVDMSLSKPWETVKEGIVACCSPRGHSGGHD